MNHARIEQLKKFLEQSPSDSFLLYALAIEYVQAGDDESALTYFLRIKEHDPDYTGMYYHLGKLHQRNQRLQLADQAFSEGLRRTLGKDAHTHHELQEAMNELNDEQDAG